MIARLAVVAALCACAACASRLPFDSLPESFTYIHYVDGTPGKARQAGKGGALHETLRAMVEKDPGGWRANTRPYAPAHYFKSDGLNVMCSGDVMVVEHRLHGSWTQVAKPMKDCDRDLAAAAQRR